MTTFAEFGISKRSQAALARQRIATPVPVQAEAVPPLLAGHDVVIQAPTGSGKTLAFLLPMIERLSRPGPGPRALIVVPVRELALQVEAALRQLNAPGGVAVLYGGVGYGRQIDALRRRPDVVIGTPGRLLDMIERRLLTLARVEYLVLDEADEMLDSGFAPSVERMLALTQRPQMVLASATMPDWVDDMIRKHLVSPVHVRVATEQAEPKLEHAMLRVERPAKLRTLSDLLRHNRGVIVFGRTKHGVKKLSADLRKLGHDVVELQGNMSQSSRDRVMASFRAQRSDVLVATNVAARGLDVSHVGLVINYELPDTAEALTHRVGRTARMGNEGRALTFLTPEDAAQWSKLRRQGAPNLAELNLAGLIGDGSWSYAPSRRPEAPRRPAPATVPAPLAGGARRPRRRRRYGGRGSAAAIS